VIFLVGARSGTRNLGSIMAMCERCGGPRIHIVYRKMQRLTLFFVPTIPVHYEHFTVCVACQRALKVTAAEAERLLALR
jgi:hypothetical protein